MSRIERTIRRVLNEFLIFFEDKTKMMRKFPIIPIVLASVKIRPIPSTLNNSAATLDFPIANRIIII